MISKSYVIFQGCSWGIIQKQPSFKKKICAAPKKAIVKKDVKSKVAAKK